MQKIKSYEKLKNQEQQQRVKLILLEQAVR